MEKEYEKLFGQYKQENPDWAKYLTDSTYYEMMNWYDYNHGIDNDEGYSDEAHEFVNYIWYKYIETPKTVKTTFDLILGFIDERIKWNEEMKKKDPKPSDIGRIEEAKCIRRYVETMMKKQRCDGCNNVKGCITCENGEQWAHITEAPIADNDALLEEIMYRFPHSATGSACGRCDNMSPEAREYGVLHEWSYEDVKKIVHEYTHIEEAEPQKHIFTLKGEVCDTFTFFGADCELYLAYNNSEMNTILDQICDIVNENYPDDEDRYNVTIQLTIDKENI